MFQVPGRRADSLRIGRYTNLLDTNCTTPQGKTVLQWRKFKQRFALNHAAKSICPKLQKQGLATLEPLNRLDSPFIIEK